MAARLRGPWHLTVGPGQVRVPPRSDAAHAHAPIVVSMREPPKLSAKLTEVRSRAPRSGVWRSLVARFVRDEEVAGSNPVTPTLHIRRSPIIRWPAVCFSRAADVRFWEPGASGRLPTGPLELPEAACPAGTRPSAAATGRAPRATARWAASELAAGAGRRQQAAMAGGHTD